MKSVNNNKSFVCFFIYSIYTAPTSPPSAISAIVFGPNIIELSWFPPPQSEQNGIIREYEIIIIEIESGSVFVEMSQNLSVSINYLHASYHYNITISAVTILNGPPSDVIFIEMPEDGKYCIIIIMYVVMFCTDLPQSAYYIFNTMFVSTLL